MALYWSSEPTKDSFSLPVPKGKASLSCRARNAFPRGGSGTELAEVLLGHSPRQLLSYTVKGMALSGQAEVFNGGDVAEPRAPEGPE